jgi:3-hydroxyisobutyrate dehydrogenase-like beta-hydroxyacid dehydrogenase
MNNHTIGILHPGAMGISIAASARNSGHTVYWASEGRSASTRARAEQHGLRDAGTAAQLCRMCDVILSVCPPHAAEDVAGEVVAAGFIGLYVDANAISPLRAGRIGEMLAQAGIAFVDGGIIGGPAWKANGTWLYLSGQRADEIAACFDAGPLATRMIGPEIGKASALKMCYAAYSKGTTALLCAVLGAAEQLGVRGELFEQWSRDGSDLGAQAGLRAQAVTAKAWRFVGEMEEIAATFRAAGMPGGFHGAAAEIYGRLAHFKDAVPPALEDVLVALTAPAETPQPRQQRRL